MDTYIFREMSPTIGSYGRRCNHSNAWTGIQQWNGLTYCIHCCEHNFRHKNFVFNLGDGSNTCTLCFKVVGQHIKMPHYQPSRLRRVRPIVPKIVLTDCGGVVRRVNKG